MGPAREAEWCMVIVNGKTEQFSIQPYHSGSPFKTIQLFWSVLVMYMYMHLGYCVKNATCNVTLFCAHLTSRFDKNILYFFCQEVC